MPQTGIEPILELSDIQVFRTFKNSHCAKIAHEFRVGISTYQD